MATKETMWKLHHIVKENGSVTLDELCNCRDVFSAATFLLEKREYDMNRQDKTAEYKYLNENGIESWRYECEEYVREVGIYPVEVETEKEE